MDIDDLYMDVFQRPGTHFQGRLKPHLPPAGSRTPMTDDGSIDIYGDLSLDSFRFSTVQNSSNWDDEKPNVSDGKRNFSQLQQPCPSAVDNDDKTVTVKQQSSDNAENKSSILETKQNDGLEKELAALKEKNKILQENISALYITAKQELDKKDEEIKALKKIQKEQESLIVSLSHKQSTSHHSGSSYSRSFLHKDEDKERERTTENYRDSVRERERVGEKYKNADGERERVREKYRDGDREREGGRDNLKDFDRERERTRENLSGKYSNHKEKDSRRDSPHSSRQRGRRSRESSPSRDPRGKRNRSPSGLESGGDVLDLRAKLKRKRKEREVDPPPSKKRDEITDERSTKERKDSTSAMGSAKHRQVDFGNENYRSSRKFDKTEALNPSEPRQGPKQKNELTEIDSKQSKCEVPKDSLKDYTKSSHREHELQTLSDKARTIEKGDQTTVEIVKRHGKEKKDRAIELSCKDSTSSKDFREQRLSEVDSDVEKETSDADSKINKAVGGEDQSPCLKPRQEEMNDKYSLRTDYQNKNCSNSADTFSGTPDSDLFLPLNSEAKQEDEDSMKDAALKPHQGTEKMEILKTGGLEQNKEPSPPAVHLPGSEPSSFSPSESSSSEQAEKMQPFETPIVSDGHGSLLSPAIVNTAPVCSNQDSPSTASPLPLPFTSFQNQSGSFSPATNETWPFEVTDSQSRKRVSESTAQKRQAHCDRGKSIERAFPVSSTDVVVVSCESISDLSVDVEKSQVTTMSGGKVIETRTGKKEEKGLQEKHIEGKIGEFRPFQGISQKHEDISNIPRENDRVNVESQSSKCLKETKHWEEKVSGATITPLQTDDSLPHLDSSSNSNETALESNPDFISTSSLQASAGTNLQTLGISSLDTESSQTASHDEQSTSAPVSSESASRDCPLEAGSGDAQTESGSTDSSGSNPKQQMVITKTTPVKAVTHITCTSNLIMLGDEESRTNFSSPSRPQYSASDFYPPGVMGIVREERTHARHIRGMPEVVRQISTGEDPTHGDVVERSSEMEVSENSTQSGINIMKRIFETEELEVSKEKRLTSAVAEIKSEPREIITYSAEQRAKTWEEKVKEQFRKVYNQDLAGFQKKALHSHKNKQLILEKAFGRLKTALKPLSTTSQLKKSKVNQKNKDLEIKAEFTQENRSPTQIGGSGQALKSPVKAPRNISTCSSGLPCHAKLSELSECNKTSACSPTEETENSIRSSFHSNVCYPSAAENRPTKNRIISLDCETSSSQLSVCDRNANSNGKPRGIGESSSRSDGHRKAICSFSFDRWKPKVIQCGVMRSRKPQENEKGNAKIMNNENADSPEEPDWMMEQILESLDCPWEEAVESDFTSTTDSQSLHHPGTGAFHTKELSSSHDQLRDNKHSLTRPTIHKDSRHVPLPRLASDSKDKTKSFASSLSPKCKVTSSDEDASSSNSLHPLACRKNKSPDSQTLEADSTCGISNMIIRNLPQEDARLSEESGRAVKKGRTPTHEKQPSNFSGLDSLRATDSRHSDLSVSEDHVHKMSSVQRGPVYFSDEEGDFSNHISQGSSEPASPIPLEEEENKSDAAFSAISILRNKDAFLPYKGSEDCTPKNIVGSGNLSTSSQSNMWEDKMSPVTSYVTEKQEECAQFPRAANEEHVLNRTFTVESPELNSDEAHSHVGEDYDGDVSDSERENRVKSVSHEKESSHVDRSAFVYAPEEISLMEGSLSEFDTDMTGLKRSRGDSKTVSSPSFVPASGSSFSKPVHSPRLRRLKEDVTIIQKHQKVESKGNETPDSDGTIEVVSPSVIPIASRSDVVNSTENQLVKRMSEVSAIPKDCEVLGNMEATNKSLQSWQQILSRQTPFEDLQVRNLVKSLYGLDTDSCGNKSHNKEPTSESECVNDCVNEEDVVESSENTAASVKEVSKRKAILPQMFSTEHIEYFKNVNKVKRQLNLEKVDTGRPCESRHTMRPCQVPASPCRVIRDVSSPDKLKLKVLSEASKSCQRKGIKNVESDRSPSLEVSGSHKHKQRQNGKGLETEASPLTKLVSQKLSEKMSITSDHQRLVSEERENEESYVRDRTAAVNCSTKSKNTALQRKQAKFAEVEKSYEQEKMPQNVDREHLEMPHLSRRIRPYEPCIGRMETAVIKQSAQSPHKEGGSTNANAESHSDLEEGEISDEEEDNNGAEKGNVKAESSALKEDVAMSQLHEKVTVSGGLQHKQQATSSKLKVKKHDNKAGLTSGHGVSPLGHLYQQESPDVKKYSHWKSDWRDGEEEEEERKRAAMKKRRRSPPPPAFGRSSDWGRRKEARREGSTRDGIRERAFGDVQERRANIQKEPKYGEDRERTCEFRRKDQRRGERGNRNESSNSLENMFQHSDGRRRNQNYWRQSSERHDFRTKNEKDRRQKYKRQDWDLERSGARRGKFPHSPYESEQTRRRSSNSAENVLYFKETTHSSSSMHKTRTRNLHPGSHFPDDQWSYSARPHTEREERSPSPQLIADACLV